MAALLPSPQPLQKLSPFSPLHTRLPCRRLSPPRHPSPCAAALHSSPADWPFEQRMREALHVLDLMQSQGMDPDPALLCTLLHSCAEEGDLHVARTVHARVSGEAGDAFVANNLINMYAKCGDPVSARAVFDGMPVRNAVSWTTVISMYSQSGWPLEALRLYRAMKMEAGLVPNAFTLATVLNSCAKVGNLKVGVEVHEDVDRYGYGVDGFVITALIDMYCKCGSVDDARKVFDQMPEASASACTAIIEGYNAYNWGKEGMDVIRKVVQSSADAAIAKKLGFATLIKSCVVEGALKQGQELHCQMIKQGYQPGARTLTALVLLYEKCDKMVLARRVFDDLIVKDDNLWNRMARGYVKNGMDVDGLKFYQKMLCEGVYAEQSVLFSMLDTCASLQAVEEGKQIHGQIMKTHCNRELEAPTIVNLAKMYYECEELDYVRKLLRWQSEQNSRKISGEKTLITGFAG